MASVFTTTNKKSMKTRNKSTQKKQLNNTIETLNQLLLRPNITIKKTLLLNEYKTINKKDVESSALAKPETNIKPRRMTNSEKVLKKAGRSRSSLISEDTEYYPDKHKRRVQAKKIVLQPKHDYRVIAAMNKRKRRIPHREQESPPPKVFDCRPEPELSMEDLVRMADDQGIDDEDFMEILTCPSPVWWEDVNGDQEEIRIRFHESSTDEETGKKQHTHTESPTIVEEFYGNNYTSKPNRENDNKKAKSLKSDIHFFNKFVKKRSKLENVLGNIKLKKSNPSTSPKKYVNTESEGKVRCDSVGTLSDTSINEEELLNTLENIEIPVQKCHSDVEELNIDEFNSVKDKNHAINVKNPIKHSLENNYDCINIDISVNDKKQTRKVLNKTNEPKDEINCHAISNEQNNAQYTTELNEITNVTDLEVVPADLPPLTKNPFRNIPTKSAYASPKSIESATSETNSIAMELDSISDTNIKFLDEYDDGRTESHKNDTNEFKHIEISLRDNDDMNVSDTNIKFLGKFNNGKTELYKNDSYEFKNVERSIKKKDDLVTVYKIIANNNDTDIEDQIKTNLVSKHLEQSNGNNSKITKDSSKINSFYKKRKNCYRNRRKPQKAAEFTDQPKNEQNKIVNTFKNTRRLSRNKVKGERIVKGGIKVCEQVFGVTSLS